MVKIGFGLLTLFAFATVTAQNVSHECPKLVVGITIDQLRGDYLREFSDNFGDGGFKRLFKEGVSYKNVEYNFPNRDKASTMAAIYTGSYPEYNGIVSEKRYDISNKREIYSFADDNYLGNFTSQKVSPKALQVSTITDELKIASGGQSVVYAIAPDCSEALIGGGHNATAAYWIEDVNGYWATTTYYKDKLQIAEQYNRSEESLHRMASSYTWRPSLNIEKYDAFPYTRNRTRFQHYFGTDAGHIRLFKQSPYVNKEVTDLAVGALKSGELGHRLNPDFLSLTFYAGNYPDASDKNYSFEIQDLYYNLDKDIERLINTIDRTVGLDNTLIFVVSTGYYDDMEEIPDGLNASGGSFYPDRSLSLLNMYLMAIYGHEQWITAYYDRQIFFNRKLIEDKKIDFLDFQQKAAEFLVQSAGIKDVITSHQMLHGAYNQSVQFYRNGYYSGVSGDLFLELQPGWQIVEKDKKQPYERVRSNAIVSPLIFFGNKIKSQKINRTVEVTCIAPTISHRLRIRAPNAAKAEILDELF